MKGKQWLAAFISSTMMVSMTPVYAFAEDDLQPEEQVVCTQSEDCSATEHESGCPAAEVPQTEANAALTEENAEPDAPTPEAETTPETEEPGDAEQPGEETPEEEPEESKAVCSIEGKEYNTLDKAIEEAEEGATIVLQKDCELTKGFNKTLTFTGTGKITINKQLTSNGVGWMCYDSGRVLTFDGEGVEVEWMSEASAPWLMLSLSGTLNITNGAKLSFRFNSHTTGTTTAIYMNAGSELNVTNGATFQIFGVETEGKTGQGIQLDAIGQAKINVTGGSTFLIDGTNRGYVNSPEIYVKDSTFTIQNCTSNASNGGKFTAINSTISYFNNMGHGLSAGNITMENSTITANENAYYGVTYSGNLTMDGTSEITANGNGYGYTGGGLRAYGVSTIASGAQITIRDNERNGVENYGMFTAEEGAMLDIQGNKEPSTNGGGIYNGGTLSLPSNTTICNNYAEQTGGGICNAGTVILDPVVKLYNNHAGMAGDDIHNRDGASISFGPVGSNWVLDDCKDPIDGWYDDSEGTRWKAHDEDPNAELHMVVESGFVAGETRTLTGLHSLKAAHGLLHTVTTSIDNNGSIDGDGQYLHGTDVQVTFRPADGYEITSVTVNDAAYGYHWDSALNAYVVDLPDLSADMHVVVTTKRDSGGGVHHPDYDPDKDDEPADEPDEEIPEEEVPLAETPWLNTVDHYAYIVGYPEDYVTGQPTEDESRWPIKPQANITRAEVATIFFRLLTDEARDQFWMTTNDFPDVAADAWYNNAISTMVNAGIIQGYEDGTFRPNDNITRAEFAAIASRFMSSGYDVEEDLFTDISGHWARENINDAAMTKWINGYPDGTFLPDNDITRAEAVTLVNNVLRRAPDADHMLDSMIKWPDNMDTSAWYYEAMQEATNSHDYDMFEGAEYETWTALEENRDWAALEQDWMNAHRGGGEVM